MKEITIVKNTVTIDGVDVETTLYLEDGIDAVQYHSTLGYYLEEPSFTKVPAEKYKAFIDEATNIINARKIEPTEAELAQQEIDTKLAEAKAYLASTDWYYPRLTETGKEVPADVVAKRIEARELINNLEVTNG